MNFTLRILSDPTKAIEIGTPDNIIDATDSGHAALLALQHLGLRLARADDPKFTQLAVEILPNGYLTEENAAKYMGYSAKYLSYLRLTSKERGWAGDQKNKKCPRYHQKMGKIFYRKTDLDAWIESGDVERLDAKKAAKKGG